MYALVLTCTKLYMLVPILKDMREWGQMLQYYHWGIFYFMCIFIVKCANNFC